MKSLIDRVLFRKKDQDNCYKINEIVNIYPIHLNSSRTRINLLIPSLNQKHMYGGIFTALKLYEAIVNYFDSCRVIVFDFEPELSKDSYFFDYTILPPESQSDIRFQIVSLAGLNDANLSVGINDVFIATIWYTAISGQKIIDWQENRFGGLSRKLIYLIQDYEPAFYPCSSRYLLAHSTYQNKLSTIPIYNTLLLRQFFHSKNICFENEYYFEPRLNNELKNLLLKKKGIKKEKKIMIYGRPNTARNAFELILLGLNEWANSYPKSNMWEIISAGEPHNDINLGNNVQIKSLGKLPLSEYAENLSSSFIGISLMASPHPSYPPLEMAHFGMRVLTNDFENKKLDELHENITSLSNISSCDFANALSNLCNEYDYKKCSVWEAQSYMSDYLSEINEFLFIENLIRDIKSFIINCL